MPRKREPELFDPPPQMMPEPERPGEYIFSDDYDYEGIILSFERRSQRLTIERGEQSITYEPAQLYAILYDAYHGHL